jgi:cytochrome c oxidase assembly protein subunit 15
MSNNRAIIIWLLLGCTLIFIMVVVGGITRLTDSGLSIVNWNLFMGAIPPLNAIEWQELFSLYQNSPEGKKLNYNYTLNEFKYIYFWEYLHRMIGRLLGLVFIIPFMIFLILGKLTKKLIKQSIILLFLGGLQGAIGWWMVKSGLVDNPHVSHYRLSIHLITAFLTCAFTFWVALPLIYTKPMEGNRKMKKLLLIYFFLVIVQIVYGAFVAGLDAGGGFNTWPKMLGEWIPEAVYIDSKGYNPIWFLEHRWGVQFIHRTLGIFIFTLIFYICNKGMRINLNKTQKKSLSLVLFLTILQTALGIMTLILAAPMALASIHQIIAFFLLMSIVHCIFIFRKY